MAVHRQALTILLLTAGADPLAFGAYQEAPMLAEQVAAGKLPPVEERLPEEPMVVKPIHQIGRYGGTWRRAAIVSGDISMNGRLGYESLLRWDRTGRKPVPNLAKSWEVKDGGRTYVLHLRRGVKWSDGHPFTAEDIRWVVNEYWQNKDVNPVFPFWLEMGGKRVDLTAPDPHTLVFRFVKPYALFPEMLAYRALLIVLPKHYLTRFLPEHAGLETVQRLAEERGFDHWRELILQRVLYDDNPELPTLKPYQLRVPMPATRVIAERNPYYWKVDPEGKQLPYIDRISYATVQNAEVLNFKALAGELSFQARHIDSANYALFMENRKKAGYEVRKDIEPIASAIYVNPHSRDEEIRPILANPKFRIALSLAVNREELIELILSGLAVKASGVASPLDPFYSPEFETYQDYDPERAARLLDEVGLKMGDDGLRRLPSGRVFRQIINCYPAETGVGADMWQLVADYWREVGLHFAVKMDARTLSVLQVSNGNTNFYAYAIIGLHWAVNPEWFAPLSQFSYHGPLYGRYHASRGRTGVKPPEEYQRLIDWYEELASTMDPERRLELGRKILSQWAEKCYVIGIVRRYALTIVSNRFRNVPDEIIHSYRVLTPGYIGIEQFYLEQE